MHTLFLRPRQALRSVAGTACTRLTHAVKWACGYIWPPVCPGCMSLLPPAEPIGFCASCYGKLPWWSTARMLAPKLPPAVSSFAAPCLYEEPLRNAILQLKFHRAQPFAKPLANMLLPHIPDEKVLLIPVPSHPSRISKRQYNHAALITRHLARATGHPYKVNALKRVGKDTPQASKTRAARLRLPASAFSANPKVFAGQTVLLIDDIYTTGATVRACALALRKAGASAVHVVTLAYTAPN